MIIYRIKMNLNCSSWRVNWLKQAWALIVLYCFKIQNSDWGWPKWSPKKTKPSQSTCSNAAPPSKFEQWRSRSNFRRHFDQNEKRKYKEWLTPASQKRNLSVWGHSSVTIIHRFCSENRQPDKKIVSVWPDVNKLPREKNLDTSFLKKHREK